nr:YbaK/EbsC family protein [Propionicimonas sp.]
MAEPDEAPAEAALQSAGLAYRVVRHRPARSLAEAAALRGISPADIIKTLVVRRAADDFLFVLVPGDREIAWPKLRAHLGVSRLSMPDAAAAFEATGYERGTITPFGSRTAWPVIADATIAGRTISLGAGEPGATVLLDADAAVAALGADLADISDPA